MISDGIVNDMLFSSPSRRPVSSWNSPVENLKRTDTDSVMPDCDSGKRLMFDSFPRTKIQLELDGVIQRGYLTYTCMVLDDSAAKQVLGSMTMVKLLKPTGVLVSIIQPRMI